MDRCLVIIVLISIFSSCRINPCTETNLRKLEFKYEVPAVVVYYNYKGQTIQYHYIYLSDIYINVYDDLVGLNSTPRVFINDSVYNTFVNAIENMDCIEISRYDKARIMFIEDIRNKKSIIEVYIDNAGERRIFYFVTKEQIIAFIEASDSILGRKNFVPRREHFLNLESEE